jgi:hypothetical protein
MKSQILKKEKLEETFQKQWTDFLDHVRLMRLVMEDVRDTKFKEIQQESIPPVCVKFSVTKVTILESSDYHFEIWIEFSIPKDDGVVIGTSVYNLNLSGQIVLKECFGTNFRPKILK